MELAEAEIGRKVIYTPFKGCDPKLKEEGVITGKTQRFVFVRYGADLYSKATDPRDIEYISL